jgi:hypothetical protein
MNVSVEAKIRRFSIGLGVFLIGWGAGCSSEETPAAPPSGGGSLPGIFPSPLPSESPSPLPAAEWRRVQFVKYCPYPVCPALTGFRVDSEGDYEYGSLLPEGPSSTGTLSPPDFARLQDQAERVASQNLESLDPDDEPSCVSLEVLPGMSSRRLELSLGSSQTFLIYLSDTEQARVCWLGDRGRAEQLVDTVDQLASEYVPTILPGSPSG